MAYMKRRVAVVVMGIAALIASAGPVAAHVGSAGGSAGDSLAEPNAVAALHGRSKCGFIERQRTLAVEQRRILKLVGDLRVLRNEADLARLAEPRDGTKFYIYSHMFASMRGMGFTVVNGGETGPGKPALLLYRPSSKAKNVIEPNGPDFPYELVGWGYASPYTPGIIPNYPTDPGLRCVMDKEWLVHERSVHPFDTWQNIPVPPVEDYHGQAAGNTPPTADECTPACVGAGHPRLWDIHLWLGSWGTATVSLLYPGKAIPGFDPGVGTGFFYPQVPRCAPGQTPPRGSGQNAPMHNHASEAISHPRPDPTDPAPCRRV